jgi:hypothetical protein
MAEEPPAGGAGLRLLRAPKGVSLTPEQQALLDEANGYVARGYELLMAKHEPGLAIAELRKALALKNKIDELKPEKQPAGKGQESSAPGTPADKIDYEGGIETILEIAETGGMAAPPDVDSGLYKRKILKSAEEEARKLQAQQQRLTQDIQAQAAAGGGGEPQQRQPQQQQAGGQPGPQQPAGQPGQQPPGEQQPGGQPGQQEAGTQPGQQPGGAPAQQQTSGVPGKQEPGQRQEGGGPSAQSPQTAGLPGRQEEVEKGLNRVATQLTQGAAGSEDLNRAAQGFRRAAAEAGRTAQQLRHGDLAGAATGSRQVERAIQAALAEAGLAGNATLEEALAAVARQAAGLQARQQGIRDQTQQIGQGAGQGPASQRVQRERARGLASEQAKLKPQIENLQSGIEELAASTGSPNPAARTAENTAKEELAGAAAGMRNARPDQAVVNAAVRLAQGDAPAATKDMTQVQGALRAVRERIAAADAALAGDAARLTRALRNIRQLAGEARRLERTAEAAAGQGEQGTPNPQQAGQPGKQEGVGQAGAPVNPASSNPQPAIPNPQSQVSPSWGQVLNKSAKQLGEEVVRVTERLRLPALLPEPSKQLVKAASQNVAFERDFAGSLGKVQSLLAALEKVETELRRKVGKEAEDRAMRDYSKEKIPSAYRKAVAEYYEELSKGGSE